MFGKHKANVWGKVNQCDKDIDSIDSFIVDELKIAFAARRVFSDKKLLKSLVQKNWKHPMWILCYDDECNKFPLITAIENEENDAVIEKLIEEDTNLEVSLCIALQKNMKNIVEMLLEAGCPLKGCCGHSSVIHCYLENPRFGLKENMFDLLFQYGVDLKELDSERSLMCFALSHGADVSDIKLLLSLGVDLNGCKSHESPMLCLTANDQGRLIKESVVKLLHDLGAEVSVVDTIKGYTPIKHALSRCNFEIGAIKLLLDYQTFGMKKNKLLHMAIRNHDCKLETLKFLVSRGIAVDNIDSVGRTPLHYAARNDYSEEITSIINFLVERGCPVNGKCFQGHSPLRTAVRGRSDYENLLALLTAGAWIGRTDKNSILWMVLRGLYKDEGVNENFRPQWFKLCLKFAYLRKNNFDVKALVRPGIGFDIFCDFGKKCVNELQRMKSKYIGYGRTLRDFTNRGFYVLPKDEEVNHFELNRLLGILGKNSFPLYHEVIAARVNKQMLIEQLMAVRVFFVNYPGSQKEKKVALNNVCVYEIVKDLHIDDLLSFVSAFYGLDNHKYDEYFGKRGAKRAFIKTVKFCVYKRCKIIKFS